MKTNREILEEYLGELNRPYPLSSHAENIMLSMVESMRKQEPRINSGFDLVMYTSVCDDDDVESEMNDYFKESKSTNLD